MTKWKRNGVMIAQHQDDHRPKHVHIFEDGKKMARFDIEKWQVLSGELTPRAKKALKILREEGEI